MAGPVPTLENVMDKINYMETNLKTLLTGIKQSISDSPATAYVVENVATTSKFMSFMDSFNDSSKLKETAKKSLLQCSKEMYDEMSSKGIEIPDCE